MFRLGFTIAYIYIREDLDKHRSTLTIPLRHRSRIKDKIYKECIRIKYSKKCTKDITS